MLNPPSFTEIGPFEYGLTPKATTSLNECKKIFYECFLQLIDRINQSVTLFYGQTEMKVHFNHALAINTGSIALAIHIK
jgi:hypothetical protein